ncbi:alpha-glucosidase/alpha-galactosidase [Yoonia sp. 2307UL14-13]|uniref:alpha-glucosidase/alpha-galactosidase n=1 Tax=Yoonia sp. 2307UL14-13 TaxID=3126506 RepID=UPI003098D757
MPQTPKITFIGAGSSVFMRNIVGDILQRPDLSDAHVALMDINAERLAESKAIAQRMVETLGCGAQITSHTNQREALTGAHFVVVAFQIGGYDPCTITDFEIPKKFGLRQTIADTLGIGGIMRGLRTIPHLWSICEDMLNVCPDATMLQYVNPMAMNTWAIARKYPQIKQVGLCHSVQGTAQELARDLEIDPKSIRYECAGINHIAFYTKLEQQMPDGTRRDLYPDLHAAYHSGRAPKENMHNPRCPNLIRYEMMTKLGYFVTESSEHFAEYVPWFIKDGREDIIDKYQVQLDEYPKRCVEQIANWAEEREHLANHDEMELAESHEYASEIINSIWTGTPFVIHGNVPNHGLIDNLPTGCAVEVACLVDGNGVQPTAFGALPPQLAAIMQSSVTVQGLVVEALMTEDPQYIYHAAMMDPHTAAELELDQIWALVDDLRVAHGDWLPLWARPSEAAKVA